MRTILWRLFPGAAALAALLLGIGWMKADTARPVTPADGHQSTSAESGAMRSTTERDYAIAAEARAVPPSPGYGAASTQAQVIVCGECGAQLAAPQAVYVAAPIGGQRARDFEQVGYYPQAFTVGPSGEYVFLGRDGVRYWTDGREVQPWRPAAPPMGGALVAQPAFYGMTAQGFGYPGHLPPPSQFRHAAPHSHARR